MVRTLKKARAEQISVTRDVVVVLHDLCDGFSGSCAVWKEFAGLLEDVLIRKIEEVPDDSEG